jgi:hypothetical protein
MKKNVLVTFEEYLEKIYILLGGEESEMRTK